MKDKLLKIIKKSGRISVDDLSIITGIDENEVISSINDFAKQGMVKQTNSNVIYLEQIRNEVQKTCNKSKKIQRQFQARDEDEFKRYLENSARAKSIFNNYMEIIEKTKGIIGKEVRQFLEIWNEENPEKKISYATLNSIRRRYKTYGPIGLIPRTGKYIQAIMKDEWIEQFLELYLSPNNLTVRECREKVLNVAINNDPEFDELSFPSQSTFDKIIHRRYTKEEIKRYRQLQNESICSNKTQMQEYDYSFKSAAANFIKFYIKAKCGVEATRNNIQIITNHLLPYFETFEYHCVPVNHIAEYKALKLKEFNHNVVNAHLRILRQIIKWAEENRDLLIKREEKSTYFNSSNVKKLLNTAQRHFPYLYPIILFAITTGASKSEILNLTWDKVNFADEYILLKEDRKVKIPTVLCLFLKKWKRYSAKNPAGLVFCDKGGMKFTKNITEYQLKPALKKAGLPIINFNDLTDIYAGFMLSRNAPINFLKEQLNDKSIDFTYSKYAHYMPEFDVNDIDFRGLFVGVKL